MVRINRRYVVVIGIICLMALLIHGKYTIYEGLGEYILICESAIALFFVFFNITKKKSASVFLPIYGAFIAYRIAFGWKITGTLTSEARSVIYVELGLMIVSYFMVTTDNYDSVIKTVRVIGSANAILGVIEYITKKNMFIRFIEVSSRIYMKGSLGTSGWRVRTFLIHPIICAVFIIVTWIILLYYPYRNGLNNYILKFCLIIALIGTKARSSWVAFLVVNAAYILIKRIKNKDISIVRNQIFRWGYAFAGLIILVLCFGDRLINMYEMLKLRWMQAFNWNHAGNYNRVKMIKLGLSRWKSAPFSTKLFGFGPSYAIELLARHPIKGWSRAVDNTYLTLLLNYGLIGVGLFVFMLSIAIYNALMTRDEVVEMAALGMISLYISAFFYDIFPWFSIIAAFCLFLLGQYSSEMQLKKLWFKV